MNTSHLQIAYLPYLAMASLDEIQIGKVKIWNYSKKANEYIPDANLRNYLDKIVSINVYRGKPIKNIGIVNIGYSDFRPLNQNELEEINIACTLLFISVLSSQLELKGDNAGFDMRTSENFRLTVQNFQLDGKLIGENTGMIVHKMDTDLLSKVLFNMPSYIVLNESNFKYDERLLTSLIKLRNRERKLFERIVRSAEIFRQSYYNSIDVNLMLRMLFQVAAFETLLQLGEKPRKEFKNKIEEHLIVPRERRYIHYYALKKQDANRTMKGKWADSFYQLRNNIVHSGIIRKTHYKFRKKEFHFNIATLFYIVLIKKLINISYINKPFNEDISWNSKEQIFEHVDRWHHIKLMLAIKKEIQKAKNSEKERKATV